MSVSSPHAWTGGVGRRPLPVNAVFVLVVAAAALGLLLGGSLGGADSERAPQGPPARQPLAHNGLRLQLPRGWSLAAAATVPGFQRPLGLHNVDEDLRAAVELLPAGSPTLLPTALLQKLERTPKSPDVLGLPSGHDAWRYQFPFTNGAQLFIYAAPTTRGIATVACLSPVNGGVPPGLESDSLGREVMTSSQCEALASAVTVPGSHAFEPGKSSAFFSRLPTVVTALDAARTKGMRALDAAKRASDQALAATDLARAHSAAGAALAPLARQGDGLPSATVGALTASTTAYAALASAARARSARAYAAASRTVTGTDADLLQTMTKVAAAARAASRTTAPAG
jgi:hypothetical protein